ncbi:MAG: cation transporter dimerization domain-containing protein [Sodalis sp. (in: enterobacteria)]
MIQLAILQLLDRELNSTDHRRIITASLHCPDVERIHDLYTRNGSDRVFVKLHVEADGKLIVDADIMLSFDRIEAGVKILFVAPEVYAYLELIGIANKRLYDLIE